MTSSENIAAETQLLPQTPVLQVACRILRSPSHESVTTDLSLFSVSSAASDFHHAGRRLLTVTGSKGEVVVRGHSPNPDHHRHHGRPADIPEILWFEEETDLIRSCAALSSAVGLQKSFSTSDISQLPSPDEQQAKQQQQRNAVSEIALNNIQRAGYLLENGRLDHTSRSCSTWVAVGDVASTSQLPSPHGQSTQQTNNCNNAGASATSTSTTTVTTAATTTSATTTPLMFTAADFIRSVNKKVRQNYIRRRLLTTYKALERLSQSEFNLDRIEITPQTAAASLTTETPSTSNHHLTVPGSASAKHQQQQLASGTNAAATAAANSTNAAVLRVVKQRANQNLPLTLRDVERERGKPLSKYERNMMIFNWLHTLDETATVEGIP